MSSATDPTPFFAAWADMVLRHRWALLATTVLLTAASAYQTRTKLKMQTSLESFTSENSDAQASLEAFRQTFGRDDVYLVMAAGDVFSMPYLQRLRKLHKALETLDVPQVEGSAVPRRDVDQAAPGSAATTRLATDTPTGGDSAGAAVAAAATADDDSFDFADFEAGDASEAGRDGADTAEAPNDAAGKAGALSLDAWGEQEGGTVIDELISLINARKVRYRDDALVVGDLLEPFPTATDLERVRREALSEPAVVGQVLGAGGKHSLIVVRTVPMVEERSDLVYHAIEKLIAAHQADGFRLAVAGPPVLTAWLKATMQSDMKVMFGGAVLVMLLVLFTLFRHPLGVVGPIFVIVMSVVWTFGMMATVGLPMTLITNIMPAFLMAVGLGDSIHLVSVYRDGRRDGLDNNAAITAAVASTGKPLLFTSMTTAVGLLSFRFADVAPLEQMGLAAAYGVGVALLHTLVFLPIVLSFNRHSLLGAKEVQGGDRLDRALWRLTGLTTARAGNMTPRRTAAALATLGAIIALSCYGMSQLVVSHNPLAWLPADNSIKRVFDEVDAEVGGTATVQLLIDTTTELGIKDLGFLRGLEQLEQHIATYRDPRMGKVTGKSVSVLDIVRETNKQLHGGDPAWHRLPTTQRAASDLLFLFENSGPDDLRRLATTDLRTTQMSVRVKWVDANAYPPLAEHVLAGVDKYLQGRAKVRVTGSIYTLGSTVSALIDNLLRSFGAAIIAITVFMMLLLKDIKLGLVSMVPNLVPIFMILGLMGLTAIPIDMGNLMLASVAIGIAVDDTIHFLHHYRDARQRGATVDDAIDVAVQHAGRAMVATSLVLSFGFCVFLAGSMIHLQRFGGLIALTAQLALVVDVVFAPPLLRKVYGSPRPR